MAVNRYVVAVIIKDRPFPGQSFMFVTEKNQYFQEKLKNSTPFSQNWAATAKLDLRYYFLLVHDAAGVNRPGEE